MLIGAHDSDLVLVGPAGQDDGEFFAAYSQNGVMGKKLVGCGEIGFLILRRSDDCVVADDHPAEKSYSDLVRFTQICSDQNTFWWEKAGKGGKKREGLGSGWNDGTSDEA